MCVCELIMALNITLAYSTSGGMLDRLSTYVHVALNNYL